MRVSYTCENLYSYTILDEESEFTFTFPQKSTDNIFKMASLSVKMSILAYIYEVGTIEYFEELATQVVDDATQNYLVDLMKKAVEIT